MKNLSSILTSLKAIFRSGNYWKLVGLGLIVSVVGLLLGVAFWLLFEGLFSLLFRWTPYWQPAHKLFGKLALPYAGYQGPLSSWNLVHFILITIPPSLLILAGGYILFHAGFVNQNLLILLINK
jgi:hypothetical protein